MERLLKETTAYKILSGDRAQNRLSHAYMLLFPDRGYLSQALRFFVAEMYGAQGDTLKRVLNGSFPDIKFFPEGDKKLAVADAAAAIEDAAIKPTEGDIKIFVIDKFDTASAAVQNKLLKSLEEPPRGVHFLLGAASEEPVLPTVRSRVKQLRVEPFSEEQVLAYLNRKYKSAANENAAKNCGGIISAAESMVRAGVLYGEIRAAAEDILTADIKNAGAVAAKYADFKHKNELLSQMQTLVFSALCGADEANLCKKHCKAALLTASEYLTGAAADVKFNAQFAALVYDFALKLAEENEKWKKLSE